MTHADEARRSYSDARNAPDDESRRSHALTSIAASLIRLGDLLDSSEAEVQSARSRIRAVTHATERIHDPFRAPDTSPAVVLDQQWWAERRREQEEAIRLNEAERRDLWREVNLKDAVEVPAPFEERPNELDDPAVH